MRNTKNNVPSQATFKNRNKEAHFWEKNFNKALATGKPVSVKFAKNLSKTLNIRLDPVTLSNVRVQAKAKGLGPTQLIRMWILEKVG